MSHSESNATAVLETPAPFAQRCDTIVIGGSQAGLAAGRELSRRDVDFVILDAEARVGNAWRRRWDSLRLFTPASRSGLPDMPFPAPSSHLPDKDEVADYLERYADWFELPVHSGVRVESVRWDGTRYQVRAGRSVFEANNVVVATGPLSRPFIPPVASQLSRSIHQLHSSEYHNLFKLPDGPVLVVGAGNSGAQIALELSQVRKVWLAGRSTGSLPRRILGRDLFDWIVPLMNVATLDTRMGRALRRQVRNGGDSLIGFSERELRQAGVTLTGRLENVRGGLPLIDGSVLNPTNVLWCTGFVPDYSWIQMNIFDAQGLPVHQRGVVDGAPGLYFLGLRFQYRMNSSLLGGVGADAEFVAGHIEQRASTAMTV